MAGIVHHQVELAKAMLLVSFEVTKAEQRRRPRRNAFHGIQPVRHGLGDFDDLTRLSD